MKRDYLRRYLEAVKIRISFLDRILSGELTDADFIRRYAPLLAEKELNHLYNDMCTELDDNLCCMPTDAKQEIVKFYYTNIYPLLRKYDNPAELADKVRGLGCDEEIAKNVIQVTEEISYNALRLQGVDSIIEQHYNIKALPTINNTDREQQVFERAIEMGYMVREGDGYKWKKSKVMLGYMIERLYCPTSTERVPEKAADKLFNTDRIGSAITQIYNAQKSQKWQKMMDSDLFFVEY